MSQLDRDIAAFEAEKEQLARDHTGWWVVFHDAKVFGVFQSFDDAAANAVAQFGRGPYLIRQIGAPPITLPASVAFRPIYDVR